MIAKLKAEKLVERANKVKQVGLAKDALKKKQDQQALKARLELEKHELEETKLKVQRENELAQKKIEEEFIEEKLDAMRLKNATIASQAAEIARLEARLEKEKAMA